MAGADLWEVPAGLSARLVGASPDAQWLQELPAHAATLAARWGLCRHGGAWSGFNSAVWSVRRDDGRELALKVCRPGWSIEPEVVALGAWRGRGAVEALASAPVENAVLLARLDGNGSLAGVPDVDEACAVIAGLLADLHRAAPPAGFRHHRAEAQSLAEDIRRRSRAGLPPPLSQRQVDQALETWEGVRPAPSDRLLHNDLHFENVLAAADGQWRAIDPYPFVGPVEIELVPALRNRWSEAAATGDPDRALRRRVDAMSEVIGGDRTRARAYAQGAAVINLLALLAQEPTSMFVAPYRVMASW